ncbi:phage Gp37/Gp68 family protein [Agrobacterium rhizogenes]|uniref:phage Gp37/Gp68 family protein n=1 Tax=Rhizobium rhizogenes TaxID=359 RepID=UPI001573C205|nr:phage Gp37/Gp68 family protein [Rhizobium rhizogenes]NTF87534.1 phage Gp37/Gp68 family protein [Rhizobium rhizogenes]
MADGTKIEWTDATWQIVTGCAVVSPGCTNCYAMRLAGTRLKHHPSRKGLTRDTKAGPVWTGEVRFNEQWLDQPLRWKKPRMIFVAAHGDLFADGVTDEQLDDIFSIMASCSWHIFQVLTKRPERMREYVLGRQARAGRTLRNVWLGVSVEDQKRAEERIPILLDTPAAIRWISAEPLLGLLDPSRFLPTCQQYCGFGCTASGDQECERHMPRIDWVVAGGESGPDARPMHPDWARSLRDQCASAGIPFLFKQWGNWQVACEANGHIDHDMARNDAHWIDIDGSRHKPSSTGLMKPFAMHRVTKSAAGRILDGIEHNAFPPLPDHFKEQQ